jgi:hypothetical protein
MIPKQASPEVMAATGYTATLSSEFAASQHKTSLNQRMQSLLSCCDAAKIADWVETQ